jgi:uncharacterized membrane protein
VKWFGKKVTLKLTREEASVVSIALVGVIQDHTNPTRWRVTGSEVANRLEALRSKAGM